MAEFVEAKTEQCVRPDGTRLFVRHWNPAPGAATSPARRKGVMLLHGLGEHSGRYEALAAWFVERGFSVCAYDHRGHGQSDGPRGGLGRDDDLLLDAQAMLEAFGSSLDEPAILLGHSLGGALAARVALAGRVRLRALVLSSPALDAGLNRFQRLLLSVMLQMAPDRALGNGLARNRLSHDPAVVQAYRDDPLVHDRVTARLVRWLGQAGSQALAQSRTLRIPTLMLVAGDDRLVNPQGSREFARGAPAHLVRLHWYEGAWHELFNEQPSWREVALADLDEWLSAQAL
jgi:alpha-beta hydrolase superfamily lysophospholipase